jgi:hypothetical protein
VTAPKTLNAQNLGWIWAVAAADAVTLAAVAFPSLTDAAVSWIASARAASASLAPFIVLLLTSLLPSEAKAALVFWRVRDVLPGHRAFSKHAPADPRIDLEKLRAAVGPFPVEPRDQNSAWYRLFKSVETNPIVAEAHRYFLLFRDVAAMSIVLAVIVPLALWLLGAGAKAVWISLGFFAVQYLGAAIAARHHGVRLVCDVLAVHATAEQKTPSKKKKAA